MLFHLRWLEANPTWRKPPVSTTQRSRHGRAHPRAGRGGPHPGGARRRTAGAARGRSPRRRRTAAADQCARDARPRGRTRPRAGRRTRPPADAIFGRHRPRATADFRRGSGAAAARYRRHRIEGRDQVARRKAQRRRRTGAGGRSDIGRRRTDVRGTDHGARRPHRQARPARGWRAHPSDRLARLDQEIASVQNQEQKLAAETSGLGDLAELAAGMETAQQGLAQSEAAARANEAGHIAARQKLEATRAPLGEADKRVSGSKPKPAHLETRQRRDQEPVAADHRRRHRRQGL